MSWRMSWRRISHKDEHMNNESRVFISLFDGKQFEKFVVEHKTSGESPAEDIPISMYYAIDGVEVEEAEWVRQCQRAIARDLASVFPHKLS